MNNYTPAKEAAYYVSKGMNKDDACKKALDLEQRRSDPSNQIQTGDNSDPIIYTDSSLNEPIIPNTRQINAIAKKLEEFFSDNTTEIDDIDLK